MTEVGWSVEIIKIVTLSSDKFISGDDLDNLKILQLKTMDSCPGAWPAALGL